VNILHVTPYFPPAWAYGGPPRAVYELCRELVRRGHSVTVATTDACDSTQRVHNPNEMLEGISVCRFPNISNLWASKHQLFLPRGAAGYLRRHVPKFDIVHLHIYRTFQNALVHRYGTRQGIPYVLSAHGTVPRILRWKTAKALFDAFYGKRLLRDAKRLIAVSHTEKLQYEDAGVPPSKISVIYNGVDSSAYRNLPPPGMFRRTYGLDDGKLVIYVGRLHARKGLVHLLRAFRDLSQARDDVHLVLIGPDDGYRAHLETLTRQLGLTERVTFAGMVSEPLKLQAYVDSDVVVYPSEHEIFGLVPFEALLCERPVVVANDSGSGEIVKSARGGLSVRSGDVEQLRHAIAVCLDGSPEITESVVRGRRFVLEELNWGRIVRDVEGVYHQAIAAAAMS